MKKVKYARMHDMKVVLPGIGQVPSELPSKQKTIPGLNLFWDDGVLVVQAAGHSCGIPSANVQFMLFDESEEQQPKKSSK